MNKSLALICFVLACFSATSCKQSKDAPKKYDFDLAKRQIRFKGLDLPSGRQVTESNYDQKNVYSVLCYIKNAERRLPSSPSLSGYVQFELIVQQVPDNSIYEKGDIFRVFGGGYDPTCLEKGKNATVVFLKNSHVFVDLRQANDVHP
jgi:hypothetical protein